MSTLSIEVRPRSETGKGAARRLRRAGWVPGVAYGHGEAAIPIQVATNKLAALLRHGGRTHLIQVHGDERFQGRYVLIKELQQDPIKDHLLHVDLQIVSLEEQVSVEVPLCYTGEAAGEVQGGRVEVHAYSLEVKCRADRIPEEIVVDLSPLGLGAVLHARDLTLPDGVEVAVEPEFVLVTVEAPAAQAVEGEEAVEETAEAEPEA